MASWAVTTMGMLLAPVEIETAADAEPLVVATPFTFSEPLVSLNVPVKVIEVVLLGTVIEYAVVPELNVGETAPLLVVNALKDDVVLAAARVTVSTYVFCVVPSSAVTTTLIVVVVPLIVTAPEAEPEVTVVPFTVTDAYGSSTVGVTVTDVVVYETLAEYAVVLFVKLGEIVPAEVLNAERFELFEGQRVTVIVYVLVVEPSEATPVTVTVFEPTLSAIEPEAVLVETVVPLTLATPPFSPTNGVSVIELTEYGTLIV